ncbi:hypothetical protein DL238_08345 [Alteriqipengyuania lutimaris]|uniref:Uncharacterized protein n=1 Tax=Alteriqipengyuania lutimaris TaxID=1538146 RepID=A0A395LL07_9SPHN|nr:hypothetical protein DL238_08345 [Alteriqipengyuania lutimaris]
MHSARKISKYFKSIRESHTLDRRLILNDFTGIQLLDGQEIENVSGGAPMAEDVHYGIWDWITTGRWTDLMPEIPTEDPDAS